MFHLSLSVKIWRVEISEESMMIVICVYTLMVVTILEFGTNRY